MKVLLDTCACIWFADAPERLSREALDTITSKMTEVFVSAVSAGELACAQRRGRVELSQHWRQWFHRQLDVNGWECLPVSLEIMEEAYSLPDPIHRDPADRILIGTARLEGMTIVTTDRLILGYPHVRSLA
jgi:PIN domain nuclease of toxin-antitoxin system